MIDQADKRLINVILEKVDRLIELVTYHKEDIRTNYLYSDTLQFEFEKIYEDISKLSFKLIVYHPELPIDYLRGIRNRIAHDYESIIIDILIDSVINDFPSFRESLVQILND